MRGVKMKIATVLMIALIAAVLSGCGSQGSVSKEKSETAAGSQAEAQESGSSQDASLDLLNCVKGTPWIYAGTSTEGSYQVSYTIDGKTQYNGKEFCKVTGHIEGAGLPAGYVWEYYFRWDAAKNNYAEVCYKLSYPGMPAQEGCTLTGSS